MRDGAIVHGQQLLAALKVGYPGSRPNLLELVDGFLANQHPSSSLAHEFANLQVPQKEPANETKTCEIFWAGTGNQFARSLRCGPVQPFTIILGLPIRREKPMKKPSKPSSAKAVSASGKPLYGTAAQLRFVSLVGGWDKSQKDLVANAATEAVNQLWLKVMTNFTLSPYRETNPQEQVAVTGDAKSHAPDITDSYITSFTNSPHATH